MSDDLATRLRTECKTWMGGDWGVPQVQRQAADEIERLRALVGEMRDALIVAETYVDITYNETDREEAGEAKHDLDKVRAVIAKADEALGKEPVI